MANQLENSKKNSLPYLLPMGYKTSGYLVTAFGVAGVLMRKVLAFGLEFRGNLNKPEKPDALELLFYTIIVTGLMTIAWTREQVEDEMVLHHRLKSMRNAFIATGIYVIAMPFLQLLNGFTINILSGTQLFIGTLLVYLISFSILKKQTS